MDNDSSSVRNLVVGLLLVAAPFAGAYLLTRRNPNAEVLLIVAVFCFGLALVFGAAAALQLAGGIALRRSPLSAVQIAILGLTLLAVLTPWSIEIAVAHWPRQFGWTNPLAWTLALALTVSILPSARQYHGAALIAGGVALALWIAWVSWRLTTPDFSNLHFSFMPVDLISTGWYSGLIAWIIAVDAFTGREARRPGLAPARDVWPLSLIPGMGLVRMGFFGRGRAWLAAAAIALAFIGIASVNDSEFAEWARYRTTPPDRSRFDVVISAAALGLVLLGSLWSTARAMRHRRVLDDWLGRVSRTRQGDPVER